MSYYLRPLLSKDQLDEVRAVLTGDDIIWADGRKSISGGSEWEELSEHKKNVEAVDPIQDLDEIRGTIFEAVDADIEFFRQVVPKTTNRPMFTKTTAGGFYCPHQDSHENGHYSTTVFLSDPETYEGGELSMMVHGNYKLLKPEAGWAVTYPTGTPHCVTPVTSGTRLVSVFWTKSLIPDPEDREWYADVMRCMSLLPAFDMKEPRTLEEAMEDPRFVLDILSMKMKRKFLQDGRY